jgi:hypothetical protein
MAGQEQLGKGCLSKVSPCFSLGLSFLTGVEATGTLALGTDGQAG